MHEIKVLKQLKDANAKNVNIIFDAFQIHSQLWIVNEYCPGGSLRTLVSQQFSFYLMPPKVLHFPSICFSGFFSLILYNEHLRVESVHSHNIISHMFWCCDVFGGCFGVQIVICC